MVNLRYKNNVGIELTLPILASAGSIVLPTGAGDLIGTNFPIKAKLTQKNATNSALVDKREIILITARPGTSDTLTVTRANEAIPLSSSSLTHQQTPQDFASGSFLEIVDTAGTFEYFEQKIDEMETVELPLKLDKAEYDAEKQVFETSSAGDDDYEITSVDITTYNNGQTFKIQADVANTGPATLKLNALAAKPIEKISEGAFVPLETGDIIANQIFWATYNSLEDCFQFSVDPANVSVPPTDVSALVDTTYPSGEAITAGQAVFVEPTPTFAQATTQQLVGDVSIDTRVSMAIFGKGVSASSMKLSLAKVSSPSVDLGIRIETDNAGNPSGTLAHANATASITAASLTTSLADTTINFAGAFTLTAGVKYHVVCFQGTYGSETVNGVNHYKVGVYAINTTTRNSRFWNGSSWVIASNEIETTGDTGVSTGTGSTSYGYRVTALTSCYVFYVTKYASSTATRCRIMTTAGSVLATATFSGNVATFSSPYQLTAGTDYRIECDNSGSSYTHYGDFTPSLPTRTNLQFVAGSFNTNTNDSTGYNIANISTGNVLNPLNFAYIDSSLVEPRALSLTNSDYAYKVDWLGFADETVGAGVFPKVNTGGIDDNQTGIVFGSTYYINSTPGSIGTSAGANSKKIAKGHATNKVKIIDIPL